MPIDPNTGKRLPYPGEPGGGPPQAGPARGRPPDRRIGGLGRGADPLPVSGGPAQVGGQQEPQFGAGGPDMPTPMHDTPLTPGPPPPDFGQGREDPPFGLPGPDGPGPPGPPQFPGPPPPSPGPDEWGGLPQESRLDSLLPLLPQTMQPPALFPGPMSPGPGPPGPPAPPWMPDGGPMPQPPRPPKPDFRAPWDPTKQAIDYMPGDPGYNPDEGRGMFSPWIPGSPHQRAGAQEGVDTWQELHEQAIQSSERQWMEQNPWWASQWAPHPQWTGDPGSDDPHVYPKWDEPGRSEWEQGMVWNQETQTFEMPGAGWTKDLNPLWSGVGRRGTQGAQVPPTPPVGGGREGMDRDRDREQALLRSREDELRMREDQDDRGRAREVEQEARRFGESQQLERSADRGGMGLGAYGAGGAVPGVGRGGAVSPESVLPEDRRKRKKPEGLGF